MNTCLIDGNNTAYRCNSVNELYHKEQRTSAIYGTINSIQFLIGEVKKELDVDISEIVCVWDFGKNKRRTDLYPEYKGQRRKNPTPEDALRYEEFIGQTNILHEELPKFGIKSLKVKGQEADDLIASYIHFAEQERPDSNNQYIIVSTDKDYLQLVDEKVSVYSPIKKIMYTIHNFEELIGVTPEQHISLKVLTGDSSDNISGIQGIGDGKGTALIKSYGGLYGILAAHKELLKSKVTARIFTKDGLATLDRNNRLMNLRDYPAYDEAKSEIVALIAENPSVDEISAQDMLKRYGLSSILVKYREWIKPFKQVNYRYYESED